MESFHEMIMTRVRIEEEKQDDESKQEDETFGGG